MSTINPACHEVGTKHGLWKEAFCNRGLTIIDHQHLFVHFDIIKTEFHMILSASKWHQNSFSITIDKLKKKNKETKNKLRQSIMVMME